MKFQCAVLAGLSLAGGYSYGQTAVDLRTQSKNVDFSAAASTRTSKTVTSLPPICTTGETVFLTPAPAGQNLYGCTSLNVWSLLGGSGSGSPPGSNGALPYNSSGAWGPTNCSWNGSSGTLSCPSGFSSSGPFAMSGATSAAGAAPASGTVSCWMDSTANTIQCKDSSGSTFTAVKSGAATAHQFLTNIPLSGIPASAQPDTGDLSNNSPLIFRDVATPAVPASGQTKTYSKNGKLCSLDPAGNESCGGGSPPGSNGALPYNSSGAWGPTNCLWDNASGTLSCPSFRSTGPFAMSGATSTAGAAPASGTVSCWMDSTANTLQCKDSGGNTFTAVRSGSATAHQFVTNIPSSGIPASAQPDTGDLSNNSPLVLRDVTTPPAPVAGQTKTYSKNGRLCSLDPAGNENCTGTGTVNAVGNLSVALSAVTDPYSYGHNLGTKNLVVGAYDSAGNFVVIPYDLPDANTIRLHPQSGFTGSLVINAYGGAAGSWGSITGSLGNQTDLAAALSAKQSTITGAPSAWPSVFTPSTHAGTHQNGGGDEIATTSPAANAIPKADAGGTLAAGWLPMVPVTISATGPVTVIATGFYYNNSAGALTYNLPVITNANIGAQFCFRNAAARTGAITVVAPASTYIDNAGVNGSAAGAFVSGGAAGDAACMVAVSTTQYAAYPGAGTWTNN